jgi:outer membrane protein OmpA-like peptidoglycan-associated protein
MRVLVIFLWAGLALHAQTYTETMALRVNGGLILNSHSGDPSTAAPVVDCGTFSGGSGVGPAFSLGLEVPFGRSIGLGVDIGFSDRSGVFSRQNTYPLRDPNTGADVTLTTDYDLETTMQYLEFSPTVILPLIGTFERRWLGLGVGPRIGLPLAKSYVQRETVVSPENGTITVDGKVVQERIISEGELLSPTSVIYGATAYLESVLPISDRVSITPRVSADYIASQLVTDADWTVFGLRAEVGIRFSFGTTAQPAPPPPVVPVVIAPVPAQPRIELQFTSFTGEVVTGNELRALTPVVTAVFFDSSSADVPASYRRTADDGAMSTDPVRAHDWILVRVAKVLRENPDARIVLEGATSGAPSESEGLALGQRRAEAVRSILRDLGVPASAMETRASVLPRVPSNSDFAGGREENRRVDIIVRNAPLQKWVAAVDFARVEGTLGLRAAYMGGDPSTRPATLALNVAGRDTVLPLTKAPMALVVGVPIGLTDTVRTVRVTADAGGAHRERDTVISVKDLPRRSISLQTGGFAAVLRFDYNSSELTDNVRSLLTQLAEILPAGSTIIIEGSADVLGSDVRNKVLSEERARNTETFMRSATSKSFTFSTSTRSDKFSDDTPQGRFLNRSIFLRVVTP